MIFQHTTSSRQIKLAGLLLTDLGRAHVVRVLGVLESLAAQPRRSSWDASARPEADAIDRYLRGQLSGTQEALGGEAHHPIVPSFVLLRTGEARLLEHQADAPDLVEATTTTFSSSTGRAHRFVYGPGVRIRLTYEDEAPMRGAVIAITAADGAISSARTCDRGWCVARTPIDADTQLHIRLVECTERYA